VVVPEPHAAATKLSSVVAMTLDARRTSEMISQAIASPAQSSLVLCVLTARAQSPRDQTAVPSPVSSVRELRTPPPRRGRQERH
jgi:hypothetical protein